MTPIEDHQDPSVEGQAKTAVRGLIAVQVARRGTPPTNDQLEHFARVYEHVAFALRRLVVEHPDGLGREDLMSVLAGPNNGTRAPRGVRSPAKGSPRRAAVVKAEHMAAHDSPPSSAPLESPERAPERVPAGDPVRATKSSSFGYRPKGKVSKGDRGAQAAVVVNRKVPSPEEILAMRPLRPPTRRP